MTSRFLPNNYASAIKLRAGFVFSTIVEMFFTLMIIHLPIILRIVFMKFEDRNADISIWTMFLDGYRYGDILGYTAGLLASSTVWFVLKFKLLAVRPKTMLFLIFAPLFLLFFATPVYLKELTGSVDSDFAFIYVKTILFISFILWMISLYYQRAIVELGDLTGNNQSDRIAKQVSKPQ